MDLFLGIAIGIILHSLYVTYIEPVLSMNLDVYGCKLQQRATKNQLDNQEQTIMFARKYPELQENNCGDGKYAATEAIGFHAVEEYGFEEE